MPENKTYDFSAVDNYVSELSSREAEETATITARNFRIKAPGYLYAGLGIGLAVLLICLGISLLLRNWDDAEKIKSDYFFYPWLLPYKSELIHESYINGNIGRTNIGRDSNFSDYNFTQQHSLLPETGSSKSFSQFEDFNFGYSTDPNTLFFEEPNESFTLGNSQLPTIFGEEGNTFVSPESSFPEICSSLDSEGRNIVDSQEEQKSVRNYVIFDEIPLPYEQIKKVMLGRNYLDPKSSPNAQWCYVERNNPGDLTQHLNLAGKHEGRTIKASLNESVAQEFGVPLEHLLYAQTKCNFI